MTKCTLHLYCYNYYPLVTPSKFIFTSATLSLILAHYTDKTDFSNFDPVFDTL